MRLNFARELRIQMNRQNMTVVQLSRKSGVTRAYIYKLLAAEQHASLPIATKIADALNMKLQLVAKK